MKMTLLLIPLLLLCAAVGLATPQTFTGTEGRDITFKCQFKVKGKWKVFCRNDCNTKENRLIETSGHIHQNDRYRIRSRKRSSPQIISVRIRNVRLSDTGRYICGLEDWVGTIKANYEYKNVFIQVLRATPPVPAPAPVPAGVVPSLHTQTSSSPEQQELSTTAAAGLSSSSLSSSESSSSPSEQQQHTSSVSSGVLLSVCGAAGLSLLLLTVFILYAKKRRTHSQEAAEGTERAHTQMEACVDVTYAEVRFRSQRSAPRCQTEAVIAQVPQVETEEASLNVALDEKSLDTPAVDDFTSTCRRTEDGNEPRWL
ncbi:uncharacterized protein LOC129409810 [Boleophthalmus pectinirostris]|uniref:uncharacterized protein LOC129409810 n=1 Tax=Boleophthalmus pectinirostris TaxID=150288 RepID=UPI00242E99C8|nr:uncharacterized protein LOC129409810 [Boleophthalmus pectinirostris]